MSAEQTVLTSQRRPPWFTRLTAALGALLRSVKIGRRERSLRVTETLSLGDKRFLAVIQVEGRRLLIGATSHSISVLDRLDSSGAARKNREGTLGKTFLHGVN